MADAAVSGGGEGDLDATVELLRLCVEKGVEVRAERGGFLLGVGEDDARWVARNTACECPWVVKDTDTKEMVLERTTLATLVLLVQSPPQWTWSQYMQASKRAKVSALSLWSFKNAQRFFAVGNSGHSPVRDPRSRPCRRTSFSSSPISPQRLARTSGISPGRGVNGVGVSRRRLFKEASDSSIASGSSGARGEARGRAGGGRIGEVSISEGRGDANSGYPATESAGASVSLTAGSCLASAEVDGGDGRSSSRVDAGGGAEKDQGCVSRTCVASSQRGRLEAAPMGCRGRLTVTPPSGIDGDSGDDRVAGEEVGAGEPATVAMQSSRMASAAHPVEPHPGDHDCLKAEEITPPPLPLTESPLVSAPPTSSEGSAGSTVAALAGAVGTAVAAAIAFPKAAAAAAVAVAGGGKTNTAEGFHRGEEAFDGGKDGSTSRAGVEDGRDVSTCVTAQQLAETTPATQLCLPPVGSSESESYRTPLSVLPADSSAEVTPRGGNGVPSVKEGVSLRTPPPRSDSSPMAPLQPLLDDSMAAGVACGAAAGAITGEMAMPPIAVRDDMSLGGAAPHAPDTPAAHARSLPALGPGEMISGKMGGISSPSEAGVDDGGIHDEEPTSPASCDVDGLMENAGLWRDEVAVVKQGAMRIGSVVETKTGSVGTVRYSGFTEFATGLWLGLELHEANGKNDGSNQHKRYFTCPPQHGLFVRPANVALVSAAPPPTTREDGGVTVEASVPTTPGMAGVVPGGEGRGGGSEAGGGAAAERFQKADGPNNDHPETSPRDERAGSRRISAQRRPPPAADKRASLNSKGDANGEPNTDPNPETSQKLHDASACPAGVSFPPRGSPDGAASVPSSGDSGMTTVSRSSADGENPVPVCVPASGAGIKSGTVASDDIVEGGGSTTVSPDVEESPPLSENRGDRSGDGGSEQEGHNREHDPFAKEQHLYRRSATRRSEQAKGSGAGAAAAAEEVGPGKAVSVLPGPRLDPASALGTRCHSERASGEGAVPRRLKSPRLSDAVAAGFLPGGDTGEIESVRLMSPSTSPPKPRKGASSLMAPAPPSCLSRAARTIPSFSQEVRMDADTMAAAAKIASSQGSLSTTPAVAGASVGAGTLRGTVTGNDLHNGGKDAEVSGGFVANALTVAAAAGAMGGDNAIGFDDPSSDCDSAIKKDLGAGASHEEIGGVTASEDPANAAELPPAVAPSKEGQSPEVRDTQAGRGTPHDPVAKVPGIESAASAGTSCGLGPALSNRDDGAIEPEVWSRVASDDPDSPEWNLDTLTPAAAPASAPIGVRRRSRSCSRRRPDQAGSDQAIYDEVDGSGSIRDEGEETVAVAETSNGAPCLSPAPAAEGRRGWRVPRRVLYFCMTVALAITAVALAIAGGVSTLDGVLETVGDMGGGARSTLHGALRDAYLTAVGTAAPPRVSSGGELVEGFDDTFPDKVVILRARSEEDHIPLMERTKSDKASRESTAGGKTLVRHRGGLARETGTKEEGLRSAGNLQPGEGLRGADRDVKAEVETRANQAWEASSGRDDIGEVVGELGGAHGPQQKRSTHVTTGSSTVDLEEPVADAPSDLSSASAVRWSAGPGDVSDGLVPLEEEVQEISGFQSWSLYSAPPPPSPSPKILSSPVLTTDPFLSELIARKGHATGAPLGEEAKDPGALGSPSATASDTEVDGNDFADDGGRDIAASVDEAESLWETDPEGPRTRLWSPFLPGGLPYRRLKAGAVVGDAAVGQAGDVLDDAGDDAVWDGLDDGDALSLRSAGLSEEVGVGAAATVSSIATTVAAAVAAEQTGGPVALLGQAPLGNSRRNTLRREDIEEGEATGDNERGGGVRGDDENGGPEESPRNLRPSKQEPDQPFLQRALNDNAGQKSAIPTPETTTPPDEEATAAEISAIYAEIEKLAKKNERAKLSGSFANAGEKSGAERGREGAAAEAGRGDGSIHDESELPSFMLPGGGMVPVTFLADCSADRISPEGDHGGGSWCKSIPMLFGHVSKNLIELREPGRRGKAVWRSRKSFTQTVQTAAKSKISKWLSGPSSASAGSVPKALAGLYLRETPSNGLAMMRRSLDYPLGGSGTKQYGAEFGMILGGVDDGGGGDCVGGVSGTKKTAAIDTSQEREGGEGGLVEKGGAFETGECSSAKADGGDAPGGDAETPVRGRYVVMLAPSGRLCVFGAVHIGDVWCMTRGVHGWEAHH